MTPNLLIVGGTGGTGQQIVKKLVSQSQPIRLLVRDPVRAESIFGNSIEFVVGDTRFPLTLGPAFNGIRRVITATGSRNPLGDNNPRQVDFEGVTNLVNQALLTGLEHFVLVSSISVTKPNHPLNRFGNVLDWKLKGEEALRKSGLTYTIVRPGGLTDDPGGQQDIIIDQGDHISGMISRADVADVCLQVLAQPNAKNATFEVIAGPGLRISADWDSLFATLKPD